jgi:hypothetical protein
MSAERTVTKENIDGCLGELAKELRRETGKKTRAEMILVGGASVLLNYSFREMTYDMDAAIQAPSAMKDAIRAVGDRLGLPAGWLNTHFVKTRSYSPRLAEYSRYYRTFSNILQVRTVSAEYLVAMKLMSGRQYKNDLSDIAGILMEHTEREEPLTLDMVKKAAGDLYGSYDKLPESSRTFIEAVYDQKDLHAFYCRCREQEQESKDILLEYQDSHPGELNGDNLAEVLRAAREKV